MIRIRRACESDADVLPEVERSAGVIFRGWPGLEWIADDDVQSADQHRGLIARELALVAEASGGRIVGFLNGEVAPDALHIWQIAVDRGNQGQGIGRQLIMAARQVAAERGIGALTLTTFRNVPWNEPYYRRLGFRRLPESEFGPRLRAVFEKEKQAGLPLEQRCAMMMAL